MRCYGFAYRFDYTKRGVELVTASICFNPSPSPLDQIPLPPAEFLALKVIKLICLLLGSAATCCYAAPCNHRLCRERERETQCLPRQQVYFIDWQF